MRLLLVLLLPPLLLLLLMLPLLLLLKVLLLTPIHMVSALPLPPLSSVYRTLLLEPQASAPVRLQCLMASTVSYSRCAAH